jgi:sulfate adenylyltransferase subunit 1 (EFTu-like GTPase family)
MDVVGFDPHVFDGIRADFARLLPDAVRHAIPVSALHGDNVITRSDRTPWFDGASLLECLETVQVDGPAAGAAFRFPVQLVVRPSHDFRGYAGQIASGTVRAGDEVTVWPAGLTTTVSRIVTWDGDLESASAPMSVTIVLGDDIDVSRGDVLTIGPVDVGTRFEAQMVWMDERPLDPSRVYLLKHAARTVTAEVDRGLAMNDIALVRLTASRPIVFDAYARNRTMGSAIVIDPATNFTAGAGMIVRAVRERHGGDAHPAAAERLVRAARTASTEADAVEAVRRALEEMLT